MKEEEQIVWEYLKKEYGENVIYEPYPNQTPDFQLNSTIAIEVRRLNQHFFGVEKAEGLEQIACNTPEIFNEILDWLNEQYQKKYPGKSFGVFFFYKRPLNFKTVKKDIKQGLKAFLELNISQFPHHLAVNPHINLVVEENSLKKVSTKLFFCSGESDIDEGGWMISQYIQNISHCIQEKSEKITNDQAKYHKYKGWWLYLVNFMWELPEKEWIEVINHIKNKGAFNRVVILNRKGQKVIDF